MPTSESPVKDTQFLGYSKIFSQLFLIKEKQFAIGVQFVPR